MSNADRPVGRNGAGAVCERDHAGRSRWRRRRRRARRGGRPTCRGSGTSGRSPRWSGRRSSPIRSFSPRRRRRASSARRSSGTTSWRDRGARRTEVTESVDRGEDGAPGFYNNFWLDRGTTTVATRRTSLVVDPADGRIPALTLRGRGDDRQRSVRPASGVVSATSRRRVAGSRIWGRTVSSCAASPASTPGRP